MIIAHHLIWTAYGWWLPNDPRGSASSVIRSDVIAELGAIHRKRNTVQPTSSELTAFLENAKRLLRHPRLVFDESSRQTIADAIHSTILARKYKCFACAVMPEHVHIVIRRHRDYAEEMLANFQRDSHILLRERGHRSFEHPVWAEHGWKVFLDDPYELRATEEYVRQNPARRGLPPQNWPFITPYDGWEPPKVRVVKHPKA